MRYFSTPLSTGLIEAFNLAYINSQKTISSCNTLLNFVLHPSPSTGFSTDKNYSYGRTLELFINPSLDTRITLSLNTFKIRLVNKTSLLASLNNPTVTDNHRPINVFIFKTKKYFSSQADSSLKCNRMLIGL
ncbi:hypothetical protein HC248_03315 [Polaromonas vacuolata]|uniref:Uncharacterized protein n=1 Tax=Polaromonas vacuolata TaxID=37448 RepID=A0A6H2HDW1_9BURK|nr:hypothetical protein HC248_03315 [Polaromonas vacuolata]